MKIAVLGSGAREHALVARFSEELGAAAVVVTPGGDGVPGSFACAEPELLEALRSRKVTHVVVGPESLLARGLADRLRAAGMAVLGPGEDDARLETSKAFAKDFMTRHRVARAKSETVRGVSVARSLGQDMLASAGVVVLKYDGLAAGKGVFVCPSATSLEAALVTIEATWGAGAEVILEEHLRGRELSLVALVAGGQARLFPPVEDHKQLLDDDCGPMTGGMGASYPVPFDSPELRERLLRDIVEPTLRGLRADHPDYRGVIFFGIMVTEEGPKLLEYNVRFGDPETQVLTVGMGESLSALCSEAAEGRVVPGWIDMQVGASICVVLAAPGYPERPQLGLSFSSPEAPGVRLFSAGVARGPDGLRTAGGRVLSLVATAATLEQARQAAYAALGTETVLQFRRDIGARP